MNFHLKFHKLSQIFATCSFRLHTREWKVRVFIFSFLLPSVTWLTSYYFLQVNIQPIFVKINSFGVSIVFSKKREKGKIISRRFFQRHEFDIAYTFSITCTYEKTFFSCCTDSCDKVFNHNLSMLLLLIMLLQYQLF